MSAEPPIAPALLDLLAKVGRHRVFHRGAPAGVSLDLRDLGGGVIVETGQTHNEAAKRALYAFVRFKREEATKNEERAKLHLEGAKKARVEADAFERAIDDA